MKLFMMPFLLILFARRIDKLRCLFPFLFLLFTACGPAKEPKNESKNAAKVKLVSPDTLFDLNKYRQYFIHKNDLSSIPFLTGDSGFRMDSHEVDSLTLKAVYQDTFNHCYFGIGRGNKFFGYIDTFHNFNVVCMFNGMGDGGDLYELLTYSKLGKRISRIEAAWLQGEEDFWDYNKLAHISGDTIKIQTTVCKGVFRGKASNEACDTLYRYYAFKDNGEIIFLHIDSILNPALDSLRKAMPSN